MDATKRNVAGLARALLALLLVAAVPASAGVVMNATRYIGLSTWWCRNAPNRSAWSPRSRSEGLRTPTRR
jgi:hypothetical protein